MANLTASASLSAPSNFDSDDRIGLGFIIVGGSVSLLCVTGILSYTAAKRLSSDKYDSDVSDSNLFLNLMVADFIHAIGVMFNLKWAAQGVLTEGKFCTAQAILIQIGNNGISLTSLVNISPDTCRADTYCGNPCKAVAIYTFLVLVLYWKPGEHTSRWIVIAIWVVIGLVVFIPNIIHGPEVYYGTVDFWCWINSEYLAGRLLTDYVWVWLAGLAMLILYPIMTIRICGFAARNKLITHGPEAHYKRITDVAKKLLLYPILYILCILPNSLARWLTFTDHAVPHRIILAANSIHAFSGFFNFIVFSITRPAMVFRNRRSDGILQQNHKNNHGFVSGANTNFTSTSTLEVNVQTISVQHDHLHTRPPVMSESAV